MSEENEAKRLARLALNRKAAQNSRQRKRERLQSLEVAFQNLCREVRWVHRELLWYLPNVTEYTRFAIHALTITPSGREKGNRG